MSKTTSVETPRDKKPTNFHHTYLTCFQKEVKSWVEYNFGKSDRHKPHQHLLGMIEEIYELESANTEDEKLDSIGDIMVYMADYCNCVNIPLESLYRIGRSPTRVVVPVYDHRKLLITLGILCKLQLKQEQNIRYSGSTIDARRWVALQIIMEYCRMKAKSLDVGFIAIIERVWSAVKERDWTKNRIDGSRK